MADFYDLMVRTGGRGRARHLLPARPAATAGLSFGAPERKMGAKASRTAQVRPRRCAHPAERLIGAEGKGFTIALAALDAGRLGIAACAVGLAQAALDTAAAYAKERQQFGRPSATFQGIAVHARGHGDAGRPRPARCTWKPRGAGTPGWPFSVEAAKAKLFATDTAMRVTTDAVQVLGGYGYVEDFPVERYMREAKVLQIVEGTNQVQRMVIGRSLTT